MVVLLLVLVLAGAAVSPHTTQPRSPPCLPALPPSTPGLHYTESLGLSVSQNITILPRLHSSLVQDLNKSNNILWETE